MRSSNLPRPRLRAPRILAGVPWGDQGFHRASHEAIPSTMKPLPDDTALPLYSAAILKWHLGYVEQPQNVLPAPSPFFPILSTISCSHLGQNFRLS